MYGVFPALAFHPSNQVPVLCSSLESPSSYCAFNDACRPEMCSLLSHSERGQLPAISKCRKRGHCLGLVMWNDIFLSSEDII